MVAHDFGQLVADLRDLRNRVRVRAYYAVSHAAPNLQNVLRQTSPRVTGRMQNATTVTPRALTATATAATPYASYVKEGTRPHIIRARPGRKLSFFWPKVGRQVWFAKVNHPGSKGNGWWDRGLSQWPAMLEASLRQAPNG